MATNEFFLPKTIRQCILYEYLRGLSPKGALSEFRKAKDDIVLTVETISKWFARFKTGHYGVDLGEDLGNDVNSDDPRAGLNDENKKKFDNYYGQYMEDNNSVVDVNTDFFKFCDEINSIGSNAIKEMEIFVKNNSQPRYVMIAVKYDKEDESGATNTTNAVLEVYHSSNGVVIRRGKQTKLLEGSDDYKYWDVAALACCELLHRKPQIQNLKLGADSTNGEAKKFFERFMNLLRDHSVGMGWTEDSGSFLQLGVVFKVEALEIFYGSKFEAKNAEQMKKMFEDPNCVLKACHLYNTHIAADVRNAWNMPSGSENTTINELQVRVTSNEVFMGTIPETK